MVFESKSGGRHIEVPIIQLNSAPLGRVHTFKYLGHIRRAELGVELVVAKICELGLRIAPHKTEALWFYKWPVGREPPRSQIIRVGDSNVQVSRYMKYLGIVLDGRWSFEENFKLLVPWIEKAVGALHRLLPNLGGPREEIRRLYAGVVRSMVLYGHPFGISHDILRGGDPSGVLSARVYDQTRALRQNGGSASYPASVLEALRRQEQRRTHTTWYARLRGDRYAHKRVVSAILPAFEAWMRRKRRVTFRLTQVLTGHGCFGEYLCRIGREATAVCHHCGANQDDAQHTLEACPAWTAERQVLVQQIGQNLSLRAVVSAMLRRESTWEAVVNFCDSIMVQKETAGRARERADPARRRRTAGRLHGLQAPVPGAE
ncbi:uncharacterized protein LOC124533080 [Vanessa cardui]|uniref:uncharacterized protein LOC124533080 n=1 Tax=Vanessa cardui TaxID=171605 RepID=UPI001F148F35|nr:uncharacterized protein LOC124533080 [Vanessa cardui]